MDLVDFRHLAAFQKVYAERSYTNAGHSLLTTRKSILRMMENLERAFNCRLFEEGNRGLLTPSPFAERLFNDLRFLNASRHRLIDHVTSIHETGRILHIGSSPAVFRTRSFRNLFREIQCLDGIRTSYTPIDSTDAGKALVSGHCDLYIGCWDGNAKRFVTQAVGDVPYRLYTPAAGTTARRGTRPLPSTAYIVSLDGGSPAPPAFSHHRFNWLPLPETRWLDWLDHPRECPEGTVIYAPDASVDPARWAPCDDLGCEATRQPLHVSFLRHHPYEFLPTLAGRIRLRMSN